MFGGKKGIWGDKMGFKGVWGEISWIFRGFGWEKIDFEGENKEHSHFKGKKNKFQVEKPQNFNRENLIFLRQKFGFSEAKI